MLLTTEVEVFVASNMVKYYQSRGYQCKYRDKILVKVEDLKENSNAIVNVKCDYDGKIYQTSYKHWLTGRKSLVQKDCCPDCTIEKMKEIMLIKYGETHSQRIQEFKEKTRQTCLEKYGNSTWLGSEQSKQLNKDIFNQKYGVDYPLANKTIYSKVQQTLNEKYGVNNVMELNSIKEKIKQTNLQLYGCECTLQNQEVKEKSKQTCLEKYGAENVLSGNSFLRSIINQHCMESKIANNNVSTSKNQKYINDLYGSQLNAPFSSFSLDMLFENEKIYCEYDGSGHKLSVKLGTQTEQQFQEKENIRYNLLKRAGYKSFRIVQGGSEKIPSDEVLLNMKDIAFYFLLQQQYNWIEFNLPTRTIKLKDKEYLYDFYTCVNIEELLNKHQK